MQRTRYRFSSMQVSSCWRQQQQWWWCSRTRQCIKIHNSDSDFPIYARWLTINSMTCVYGFHWTLAVAGSSVRRVEQPFTEIPAIFGVSVSRKSVAIVQLPFRVNSKAGWPWIRISSRHNRKFPAKRRMELLLLDQLPGMKLLKFSSCTAATVTPSRGNNKYNCDVDLSTVVWPSSREATRTSAL